MNDLARRAFALVFAFLLVTSIPFAVVELGGPDVSTVGTVRAEHNVTLDGHTHLGTFETDLNQEPKWDIVQANLNGPRFETTNVTQGSRAVEGEGNPRGTLEIQSAKGGGRSIGIVEVI